MSIRFVTKYELIFNIFFVVMPVILLYYTCSLDFLFSLYSNDSCEVLLFRGMFAPSARAAGITGYFVLALHTRALRSFRI